MYGEQLKQKCTNLLKMYGKFVREAQVKCGTFTGLAGLRHSTYALGIEMFDLEIIKILSTTESKRIVTYV